MPKSNTKSIKRPKISRPNVYLDNASATPLDPLIAKTMASITSKYFANPSAIHNEGVEVKKILENARTEVAVFLGAHADEIIFTSGATESNNLAILGILKNTSVILPHIVTTNIEHASVLELCKNLEKSGKAEISFVPVESNGIVDPRKIKKALKTNTVLVSVMYANNEIGTIQPIREIAKEIRHFNKNNNSQVLFHTDATQAVNYLSINVEKLGVDLLTLNAAKIYGPKSIGLLYIRRGVLLAPVYLGGDQEFGLRPGTENVASAVALAQSLQIVEKIKEKETKRLTVLRDYFIGEMGKTGTQIIINGDLENRLPNNINITVPNIPSDLLVIELSARGIMSSAKSACKSGDGKSSYVIKAINPHTKDTDGSIRFSLGRYTTRPDVVYTLKSLRDILLKLEKWYQPE